MDGEGVAAILDGRTPLMLDNLEEYNGDEFSYTFWIYAHSFQRKGKVFVGKINRGTVPHHLERSGGFEGQ